MPDTMLDEGIQRKGTMWSAMKPWRTHNKQDKDTVQHFSLPAGGLVLVTDVFASSSGEPIASRLYLLSTSVGIFFGG